MQIDTPIVAFDLDGTLYSHGAPAFRIFLRQLGHLKLLFAERKLRTDWAGKVKGPSFEQEFFEELERRTHRCNTREWFYGSFMPAFIESLRRGRSLRPELRILIDNCLQKGIRIAVFSDYPCTRERLEAIGFNPLWAEAGIYDSHSFGGLKPASFDKLVHAVGVQPSDITFIGDRPDTDKKGALDMGLRFIRIK